MSKKNFKGGLSSLLGEQVEKPKKAKNYIEDESVFFDLSDEDKAKREKEKRKVGRPQTVFKTITKSSQEGTKENETRATFILNEELLDKLKAVAYWDRLLVKDALNTILLEYFDKKKPKPRPEQERLKDQTANQRLIKIEGNKARLPKY
jgi:predicted ArsR family transcriptional regulator